MTRTLPPVLLVTCPTCRREREVGESTWYKARREGPGRCVGCVRATGGGPRPDPRPTHCRHCTRHKATRSRGLCFGCFITPEVKALYPPSTSAFNNRGLGHAGFCAAPLPAEPTDALPGTPEKIAVMKARAARGERVFHPRDATGRDPMTLWALFRRVM